MHRGLLLLLILHDLDATGVKGKQEERDSGDKPLRLAAILRLRKPLPYYYAGCMKYVRLGLNNYQHWHFELILFQIFDDDDDDDAVSETGSSSADYSHDVRSQGNLQT